MIIKHFIIVLLATCSFNVKSIDSDSLFIRDYKTIVNANYKKWHKRAEKKSFRQISRADTIMFVPHFSLKKSLPWDYECFDNNAQYASWDCLELRRRWYIDALFVRDNNKWGKVFLNVGRYKQERFLNWNHDPLLAYINRINPEGVFTIGSVPGFFIIKDERIMVIENNPNQLVIHENAREYLIEVFTEPYFLPLFSGEEY